MAEATMTHPEQATPPSAAIPPSAASPTSAGGAPSAASAAGLADRRLIIPFVNSIRQVFATMVHQPITLERPRLKGRDEAGFDVSTTIGFLGNLTGSMGLGFPLGTAIGTIAAFTGQRLDPDSEEFFDAACELASMIVGAARKELGEKALVSVPTVIIGTAHRIGRLSDVPCVVIPCVTSAGAFSLEINVKETPA
jgi:CheY-specific phosphatase CheX